MAMSGCVRDCPWRESGRQRKSGYASDFAGWVRAGWVRAGFWRHRGVPVCPVHLHAPGRARPHVREIAPACPIQEARRSPGQPRPADWRSGASCFSRRPFESAQPHARRPPRGEKPAAAGRRPSFGPPARRPPLPAQGPRLGGEPPLPPPGRPRGHELEALRERRHGPAGAPRQPAPGVCAGRGCLESLPIFWPCLVRAGRRRIRRLRAGTRSCGPGPPVCDYRGRGAPSHRLGRIHLSDRAPPPKGIGVTGGPAVMGNASCSHPACLIR